MEKNGVTSLLNVAGVEVVIVDVPLFCRIGASIALSLGWWKFANSMESHPRATIRYIFSINHLPIWYIFPIAWDRDHGS
jgi:hypothetical protein